MNLLLKIAGITVLALHFTSSQDNCNDGRHFGYHCLRCYCGKDGNGLCNRYTGECLDNIAGCKLERYQIGDPPLETTVARWGRGCILDSRHFYDNQHGIFYEGHWNYGSSVILPGFPISKTAKNCQPWSGYYFGTSRTALLHGAKDRYLSVCRQGLHLNLDDLLSAVPYTTPLYCSRPAENATYGVAYINCNEITKVACPNGTTGTNCEFDPFLNPTSWNESATLNISESFTRWNKHFHFYHTEHHPNQGCLIDGMKVFTSECACGTTRCSRFGKVCDPSMSSPKCIGLTTKIDGLTSRTNTSLTFSLTGQLAEAFRYDGVKFYIIYDQNRTHREFSYSDLSNPVTFSNLATTKEYDFTLFLLSPVHGLTRLFGNSVSYRTCGDLWTLSSWNAVFELIQCSEIVSSSRCNLTVSFPLIKDSDSGCSYVNTYQLRFLVNDSHFETVNLNRFGFSYEFHEDRLATSNLTNSINETEAVTIKNISNDDTEIIVSILAEYIELSTLKVLIEATNNVGQIVRLEVPVSSSVRMQSKIASTMPETFPTEFQTFSSTIGPSSVQTESSSVVQSTALQKNTRKSINSKPLQDSQNESADSNGFSVIGTVVILLFILAFAIIAVIFILRHQPSYIVIVRHHWTRIKTFFFGNIIRRRQIFGEFQTLQHDLSLTAYENPTYSSLNEDHYRDSEISEPSPAIFTQNPDMNIENWKRWNGGLNPVELPKSDEFGKFWIQCWREKVSKIIILESHVNSSLVYWPLQTDQGLIFQNLYTVKLHRVDTFTEYIRREFVLSNIETDQEHLTVQYQLRAWPKTVSKRTSVFELVHFWTTVVQLSNVSSHCPILLQAQKSQMGRVGTIMAFDHICVNSSKFLYMLPSIRQLRLRWPNLFETFENYMLLHEMVDVHSKFREIDLTMLKSSDVTRRYLFEKVITEAKKKSSFMWNKCITTPFYNKGTFLGSYRSEKGFILAEIAKSEKELETLLSMIYESNLSIIIVTDGLPGSSSFFGKVCSMEHPDGFTKNVGSYEVYSKILSTNKEPDLPYCLKFELSLSAELSLKTKTVLVFHLVAWKNLKPPVPPETHHRFYELCDCIITMNSQLEPSKAESNEDSVSPILLISEKPLFSCSFMAVALNLIEHYKLFKENNLVDAILRGIASGTFSCSSEQFDYLVAFMSEHTRS